MGVLFKILKHEIDPGSPPSFLPPSLPQFLAAEDCCPFLPPSFAFIDVETLGRVYTLLLPSSSSAATWLREVQAVMAINADPSGRE